MIVVERLDAAEAERYLEIRIKMNGHGGRRPGAGRPKGSKDPHTVEKQEYERQMRRASLATKMRITRR